MDPTPDGLRKLVGRDDELAELAAIIEAAGRGRPGTAIISGEAGVGKTALVSQALAVAPSGTRILRGGFLPMRSLPVGLLPLRSALRRAASPPADASDQFSGSFLRAIEAGRPIEGFEDYLAALGPIRPLVLFFDDLQWADQSTLDLLMYLAAGVDSGSYAVIVTLRTADSVDDSLIHSWLSSVLRLPGVSHRIMHPLDRFGTEAQLTQLLGATPHQSLVDEIFARSCGNPYFTSLLARDLGSAARHLPAALPPDLLIAVGRLARQLPPAAREIARLLAVGGRPTSGVTLTGVAAAVGLGAAQPALDLAEQAGLIECRDRDLYWFGHPLPAEELAASVPPGMRRQWHHAFAEQLRTARSAQDETTFEQTVAIADHLQRAGGLRDAYGWALRAADLAVDQASPELIVMLQSAVDLRARADDAEHTIDELLARLSKVAARAGAEEAELAAIEQRLASIDEQRQPLLAAGLLIRRTHLRMSTGAGFLDGTVLERAERLAEADPESWQYALALAERVHAGAWAGERGLYAPAQRAVELARRSGDDRTLSYALVARSMVELKSGDRAAAFADAAEAVDFAGQDSDWWAFVHAVMWEHNAELDIAGVAAVQRLRQRRQQLTALGAPHSQAARIATVEAEEWLTAGDFAECAASLRLSFSADPGAFADAHARLTAAQLAAWQGRTVDARAQLSRAEELIRDHDSYLNYSFAAVRAMVLLEEGRPGEAFEVVVAAATRDGLPPHLCEWLVPLACRALADQADAARDAGDEGVDVILHRLGAFLARHPSLLVEPGEPTPDDLVRRRAWELWRDAEIARAHRDPSAAERWSLTAAGAQPAKLRWLQAYALWRAAESGLGRHGRLDRIGIQRLREGYELAEALAAEGILRELRALAASARITLSADHAPLSTTASVPGLTAREQEILHHLVSGATYAQIAETLVISEKTVSSHVSNMLRKTGTTNRVQLAQLARRTGR